MSLPAAASSTCTFLPSLTVRGGLILFRTLVLNLVRCRKRLVARANVNSTGFRAPEAVVPNYDIWSIRKGLEVPVSAFSGDSARAQGGPPPMLVERFQSIISQLFQQRIIRCGGAVDDDMANLIVTQLLYLEQPHRDSGSGANSGSGNANSTQVPHRRHAETEKVSGSCQK